jgi:hypothetical protein
MGLPVVVVHRRARLKANKGIYLIRTGCLSSDNSKRYATKAFSSSGVRYCWPWAFSRPTESVEDDLKNEHCVEKV